MKVGEPAAVGHRVVHGGPKLREHQLITAEVKKELKEAVHFAPLHIPAALELIEVVEKVYPESAAVCLFRYGVSPDDAGAGLALCFAGGAKG